MEHAINIGEKDGGRWEASAKHRYHQSTCFETGRGDGSKIVGDGSNVESVDDSGCEGTEGKGKVEAHFQCIRVDVSMGVMKNVSY